jgi:hypothetical protein
VEILIGTFTLFCITILNTIYICNEYAVMKRIGTAFKHFSLNIFQLTCCIAHPVPSSVLVN